MYYSSPDNILRECLLEELIYMKQKKLIKLLTKEVEPMLGGFGCKFNNCAIVKRIDENSSIEFHFPTYLDHILKITKNDISMTCYTKATITIMPDILMLKPKMTKLVKLIDKCALKILFISGLSLGFLIGKLL